MRLRESTNTQPARGGSAGGGGAGCREPNSSPPASTQYYALNQRGGPAQPLSDLDFVHSLLSGSVPGVGAGGGGPRKRNSSSAGGHRGSQTARENGSSREGHAGSGGAHTARDHAMKEAYSKPRTASAYARSSTQRSSVQAW